MGQPSFENIFEKGYLMINMSWVFNEKVSRRVLIKSHEFLVKKFHDFVMGF